MTTKKNKTTKALLAAIFLVLLLSGQCNAEDDDILFQVSTIDALIQGIFNGETTFETLAKNGDFGLGTFNALDGEMLALDGKFYQITSDGKVHSVPPDARTPFAAVTFFAILTWLRT